MCVAMDFEERLNGYVQLVNEALQSYLPETDVKQREILKAMRYSLFAGGKRLRPALLLEFCRVSGGDLNEALPFACALEMIHTYSLIHDDLPCMDDDDLRRGKPTNHKVFGEALAVLSGDGLLNAAFELMLDPGKSRIRDDLVRRAAFEIARAAGIFGMVGGQVIDLSLENRTPEIDELKLMDSMKTGALIAGACRAGCILAGAPEETLRRADEYAAALGLAFQIRDDMLDVLGDEKEIGKPTGSDEGQKKATYMSLLGAKECSRLISALTKRAKAAAESLNDGAFLYALADTLAVRNR